MLRQTNTKQFEVTILGARRPSLGEIFEIEISPYRKRVEVECVDKLGSVALVERTDNGPAVPGAVQSRVISDLKVAPPDMRYGEKAFDHASTQEMMEIVQGERDWDDHNTPDAMSANEDFYEDWGKISDGEA